MAVCQPTTVTGCGSRTWGRQGAEAAELFAEGGTKGLKLRLGRENLADDLAAIDAVRAAAGADIRLMVDFNQGMTLGDALHRCHALDDQGLYWLEEPIAYDDLGGHARLARELRTPVQLGENFYGPRAVAEAVAAAAGDFVDARSGRALAALQAWLRAAAIAGAAGPPMSSHLYPEFSAHLLRVTETAHVLEWQDWAYEILAEPFELVDGNPRSSDRPGAGIEWDEKAVAHHALNSCAAPSSYAEALRQPCFHAVKANSMTAPLPASLRLLLACARSSMRVIERPAIKHEAIRDRHFTEWRHDAC